MPSKFFLKLTHTTDQPQIKSKKKQNIEKHAISSDPRFNDNSGTFKQENFDKHYGFISDLEKKELQNLKKEKNKLSKARHKNINKGGKGECTEEEHRLISVIRSKTQRMQAKEKRLKDKKLAEERKKQEIEAVKEGKKAYYGDAVREQTKTSDDSSSRRIKKSDQKGMKRKNMPADFRRSAKNRKQ